MNRRFLSKQTNFFPICFPARSTEFEGFGSGLPTALIKLRAKKRLLSEKGERQRGQQLRQNSQKPRKRDNNGSVYRTLPRRQKLFQEYKPATATTWLRKRTFAAL